MRIFIHTSGIVHVWNFLFYLKIAAFRQAVLSYVSCGYHIRVKFRKHKHGSQTQLSYTN